MDAIPIQYDSENHRLSWKALLELHAKHPKGWTLIGGQMVLLHCWERGADESRVTTDADAGLDLMGFPKITGSLTSALKDLGFTPSTTINNVQHRWIRESDSGAFAQIDILIPHSVGPRAQSRPTATGGIMLESFGIQQALQRSTVVNVALDGSQGYINRPNLLGALIGKAAAIKNVGDTPGRHLDDLIVLAGLLKASDIREQLTPRDRTHLSSAMGMLVRLGKAESKSMTVRAALTSEQTEPTNTTR